MKKSATKFLVAVLCLSMVLGTSISAMAAVTATSTDVKLNITDGSMKFVTNVTTTGAEEVTYMVHNAADLSSVEKGNIKYIDQKNIDGTGTFEVTLSNYDAANDKIYVGGKNVDAPIEQTPATVTVNGVAENATLNVVENYIKVAFKSSSPAAVTKVDIAVEGGNTYENVDFVRGGSYILAIKPADLASNAKCSIEITTDADTSITASAIKLGKVTLTDTALTAYAKVTGTGFDACGINVNDTKYEAFGVGAEGAFAVELAADGGLLTEFAGATVKAYVDSIESEAKILD